MRSYSVTGCGSGYFEVYSAWPMVFYLPNTSKTASDVPVTPANNTAKARIPIMRAAFLPCIVRATEPIPISVVITPINTAMNIIEVYSIVLSAATVSTAPAKAINEPVKIFL